VLEGGGGVEKCGALFLDIVYSDFFFDGPIEGWDESDTKVGVGLVL
jgi:hypothetical protein